jgi:hypothetical protein
MSDWKHFAEWIEFRAEALRKEGQIAEKHIHNEASEAYVAALNRVADIADEYARVWRKKAEQSAS